MIQITKNGKIFLLLPGKSYKARRYLGYIEGDTFHTSRNPEKHLFHRMNAYGFCHELVRNGSFSNIVVHLPFGETLVTTRRQILELGEILNYKSHLLEMQIFLRIALFGNLERMPEETTEPQEFPPAEQPASTPLSTEKDTFTDEQPDLFGGGK